MSYVRKGHEPMGVSISSVVDYATIGASVATSPNFKQVISLAKQISDLPAWGSSGGSSSGAPATAAQTAADVNSSLGKAVPLLKTYIYVRKNPWVIAAAVGAAVGVPMMIGYWLGKGRRA